MASQSPIKYALIITPVVDYGKLLPEAKKWQLTGTHEHIVKDTVGVKYIKDSIEYAINCMPAHWFKEFGKDDLVSTTTFETNQKKKVPKLKLIITDNPSGWLKDNGYVAPKSDEFLKIKE